MSIDRAKLAAAQSLAGTRTASATIDAALSELIRAERLRRDIAAYAERPVTEEEVALSRISSLGAGLEDDTDWEALYAEGSA